MVLLHIFKAPNKQMLLLMHESCEWPRVNIALHTTSLTKDDMFNKRNETVWLCMTSVSHGYKV